MRERQSKQSVPTLAQGRHAHPPADEVRSLLLGLGEHHGCIDGTWFYLKKGLRTRLGGLIELEWMTSFWSKSCIRACLLHQWPTYLERVRDDLKKEDALEFMDLVEQSACRVSLVREDYWVVTQALLERTNIKDQYVISSREFWLEIQAVSIVKEREEALLKRTPAGARKA